MKEHVVYKITSKINNKCYIGSTIDYKKRINLHLCCLKKQKHGNKHLQNHYNKHGKEDLIFSILEVIMFPELLVQREQHYLDTVNPEFNIKKVSGNYVNPNRDKSIGERISKANLGRKVDAEGRRNMSIAKMGNTNKKGTKVKCNKNLLGLRKGIPSPMKGKHHSLETKLKISLQKKGVKQDPLIVKKRNDANRGKPRPTMKNKPWSEARRKAQLNKLLTK